MTTTSTLTRAGRWATAALASAALLAGCSAGSGTAEPTPTDGGTGADIADGGSGTGTGGTGTGGTGSGGTGSDGTGGEGGGSDETVRVGLVAEPASLDFTTSGGAAIPQVMMDNVYETLVTIDEGEIVPALAQSWEIDEGRTTYTFTLKEGVTFSTGAEFTAEDARFSLERVSSDAWTNGLAAKLDVVESVEAPDDTTLVVTLSRPSNQFLYNLTTLVGAMFDTEGVDDLANEPVGTGPFVFESWDRGSMITLRRNEDYHGDAPYFGTVEMRYFRDGNALNNAMLTDAIDVVATVQAPEALMEFEGGPYQIIEGTTNGEIVLSMNQQEGEPLADLRLRQAVRHAIDHQSLMDTCWAGKGVLIGSMVPPTDPWYEDRTGDYPFDQDRARELIEEAGAEDAALRLRIPTLPYAVSCGTVVESMLEDVGLDVTIDELEFPSAWLETVFTNKDYDLSIVSHVEGRDLAQVFGNPDYYTTYGTEELRALLEAADSGTEEQEIASMQEAARLISEDAAADFLFLLPNLMVAEPDITGLPQNILAESFPLADLARE